MIGTLDAIRRRDPDAAVANLTRLLQEDRDRAIAALSDLRGEAADLKALPFTDHHETPAGVA
jgi:hypothetical protein